MSPLFHSIGTANYTSFVTTYIEVNNRDFPGVPVVNNPPSIAGDQGSVPGQGTNIPHGMPRVPWGN